MLRILMTLVCFLPAFLQAENLSFTAPTVSKDTVRFAVISDLTGGERTGIFDVAVEQISALQPDFILTIGDLIEGGTEDTNVLDTQWKDFTQRIDTIGVPYYPLVGNHDISNVTQRLWWEQTIGPRYYHFRYKDILFLMLDSEDFTKQRFQEIDNIRMEGIAVYKSNPEKFPHTEYASLPERTYGTIAQQQASYFIEVIDNNRDARWTFVLMHKPVWWASEKNEPIERQTFLPIENALKGMAYTVLNGHVHKYHHSQRLGRDYIQLGTTGGAFTPADNGRYLDHILWVSITDKDPHYLNLTLGGMLDKQLNIPANGSERCLGQLTCVTE